MDVRIVKNFIAKGKFEGEVEKDIFGNFANVAFSSVTKKPITAEENEVIENPRARSAKLRIAERRLT